MTTALMGNGLEYDLTMKIADNCKTTTSQFKAVVFGFSATSDWTVKLISGSASSEEAEKAFGVIQSYQTAGSSVATVRTYGMSKVYAAAAIDAGAPVVVYNTTAGSALAGYVTSFSPRTDFTGSSESYWVLGRALQKATATGQAIAILVNPHLAYKA